MIEYPIAAAQLWNPIVVCGLEVEQYLLGRTGIELVRNDEPERGMSHSLALANRIVAADLMLLVLLGDKPLISRSLIESTYAAPRMPTSLIPCATECPVIPSRSRPAPAVT